MHLKDITGFKAFWTSSMVPWDIWNFQDSACIPHIPWDTTFLRFYLNISKWTAKMGSARRDDLQQITTCGNSVLPFHSTFSLLLNFSRNLQPWCCITSSHPDQSFSYGWMSEKSNCIQQVWRRGNVEGVLQLMPASGCGIHPGTSFHSTNCSPDYLISC